MEGLDPVLIGFLLGAVVGGLLGCLGGYCLGLGRVRREAVERGFGRFQLYYVEAAFDQPGTTIGRFVWRGDPEWGDACDYQPPHLATIDEET
jgi:hypothetical protein